MSRAARASAAALALLAACSRPPAGMKRLDAGAFNHWFKVDSRMSRLYYMEGGGSFVTKLGVVDLDTGRRRTFEFPHEKIVGLRPAVDQDAVKLATEGTGVSNDGQYKLLLVDADSGKVRAEETPETEGEDDLAFFGETRRPDAPPGTPAFATARSTAARDDGADDLWYETEGGRRPGIRATLLKADGRLERFFPTPTEPNIFVGVPRVGIGYAAYAAPGGTWNIEELRPVTGVRRVVASFPSMVESMAPVGQELVALRRSESGSGPRALAMIDPMSARVAYELPWSDGESEILGADAAKRLLYIRMDEGGTESCWSIHFDEKALRAASKFLARHRGSGVRKFTFEDGLFLGMMAAVALGVAAVVAVREF